MVQFRVIPGILFSLAVSQMLGAQEAPCTAIIDQTYTVLNYSNFSPSTADFYTKYYKKPESKEEARELISSLYSKNWLNQNCVERIHTHLNNKPDVYIYVGGFGRHVQLNETYIDAAEVVKWINKKDPNALVLSLGWNCESAVAAGKTWCRDRANEYTVADNHIVFKTLDARTRLNGQKVDALTQLKAAAEDNSRMYNESLTHSLELSAHLINDILAADIGNIHIVGYSLGAQIVTEIMSFDYDKNDNKEGFPWSVRDVCSNGEKTCRVSELSKVKWGLAMGAPGWAQALRNSYNGFSEIDGLPLKRSAQERADFENGGLLRIKPYTYDKLMEDGSRVRRDLQYNDKLVVFNKRYDPTSYADDNYQRGIGSSLLAEYNHIGHDYNRPYFWNQTWVSTMEKYLVTPTGKDSPEWGVVWESGANFDFEDCSQASCSPASLYPIHFSMQSHHELKPMRPLNPVRVVNEGATKAVAFENSNDATLEAFAMDQEDLRGSVEFSWKPKFEVASTGVRGLFSYGSCSGDPSDLMPQAYVKNGALVLEIKYQGLSYVTQVDPQTLNSKVRQGEWAHVAFGWNLPTVSLADEFNQNNQARAQLANQYGSGIIFAASMMKAPRTSMVEQRGQGSLKIWINGEVVAESVLGQNNSQRDCLTQAEVVSPQSFSLLDGVYPAYNPYLNYTSDQVPNVPNGKLCKGYKVRNSPVHFGCAKDSRAASLMDNVRIVFGAPRSSYPEIAPSGGLPKSWSEVLGIL